MAAEGKRQVNIQVDASLYSVLESVAREERRTVAQAARRLIEDAVRQRIRGPVEDNAPASELAHVSAAGGTFDWLSDEPDLYDDTFG